MKQILFVSDFKCNPNSGAAGSLLAIGDNMQKIGCQVDYIWEKPQDKRIIKSPNLYRFLELPFVQYKQIKRALSQKNYDAIIISQPHAWYAIKKLKKIYPSILFINRTHGWEKRIESNTWSIEFAGLNILSKIKRYITFCLTCHCSYMTLRNSDAIICASKSDSNFIRQNYPKYSNKVFCISYGLDKDFELIDIGNKQEITKTKFLFAGQYVIRKGIKDIKQVFEKLSTITENFELTFIVNQDSIESVKNDFQFLRSKLTVLTWMNRKSLIELYKKHDVFLMPSYGEGFGKTTFEAMACGLCVIGYKEGALEDFGQNKINSLISRIGDIQGFYDNIQFSIDHPNFIKNYGFQAYNDVQKYTWSRCSENTLQLLSELKECI